MGCDRGRLSYGRRQRAAAGAPQGRVHADIAVTRKDEQGHQGRIEESMVVSHVLGSACAVAYNPGTRADEWEPLARLVLEASYEACVLAALENRDRHDGMAGSKKLFLTLLGGDAFGNPQSWILDAIRRALRKFEHEDLDVFLVCYEGVDASLGNWRRSLTPWAEDQRLPW